MGIIEENAAKQRPAKAQAGPATRNASVTDGPARSAMAAAVRTKSPAPMIAPMPSATSDIGPSVRFSVASPVPATSFIRRSMDFVRNNAPATMYPLSFEDGVQ